MRSPLDGAPDRAGGGDLLRSGKRPRRGQRGHGGKGRDGRRDRDQHAGEDQLRGHLRGDVRELLGGQADGGARARFAVRGLDRPRLQRTDRPGLRVRPHRRPDDQRDLQPVADADGDQGRDRWRHGHEPAGRDQLRLDLRPGDGPGCRDHVDRGALRRLAARRLVRWRVLGDRHLRGDPGCGQVGDRDVQPVAPAHALLRLDADGQRARGQLPARDRLPWALLCRLLRSRHGGHADRRARHRVRSCRGSAPVPRRPRPTRARSW